MRILRNWQASLHAYFLRKQLNAEEVERKSVDYNIAQTIGVIFNASDVAQIDQVRQFIVDLKSEGKEVKVLCFLNEKEQQPNLRYTHFSRKELDWISQPKDVAVEQFINTPFDYLINLDTKGTLPLQYISARSKASVRVGPYTNKPYCFDLMIEINEDQNFHHYINQLTYLLKRLNRRKHAEAIV